MHHILSSLHQRRKSCLKVHARFRFILKSNINTENGDARICLNERLSYTIAANFLEILAPMHTWRFNVSCFEVLDATKVRFKLKKGVLVVKFAFATEILKIETLRMRRRFARVLPRFHSPTIYASFASLQLFPFFHNLATLVFSELVIFMLIGNQTSFRPIRSVIILVINKSDDPASGVRFCYHSYDYRPNWTSFCPITISY